MTPAQRAYFAGIIDGEGSISLVRINKNSYPSPMISVASADIELLEWLVKTSGCGSIISKKNYKPSQHKNSYALNITYNNAIRVLREIETYLVIDRKRKRAKHILENYLSVTPRNGRYSPEMLSKKERFYQEFMSL